MLFVVTPFVSSFFSSIVYIISAPASPVLGFMVDRTGKNIMWVLCAVVTTLLAHMMLAFTFWNPWFAMVKPAVSLKIISSFIHLICACQEYDVEYDDTQEGMPVYCRANLNHAFHFWQYL